MTPNYPELIVLLFDQSVGTSNIAKDILENIYDCKIRRNSGHRFKVIHMQEGGMSGDQWGPQNLDDLEATQKRIVRWARGFNHEAVKTKEELNLSRCFQELDRTFKLLEGINEERFAMALRIVLFHNRERVTIPEDDFRKFFSPKWTFFDMVHFNEKAYEQCVSNSASFPGCRTLHFLQDPILLKYNRQERPTDNIQYLYAYMKLHSDVLSGIAKHFQLRQNVCQNRKSETFHTWKPRKPKEAILP